MLSATPPPPLVGATYTDQWGIRTIIVAVDEQSVTLRTGADRETTMDLPCFRTHAAAAVASGATY